MCTCNRMLNIEHAHFTLHRAAHRNTISGCQSERIFTSYENCKRPLWWYFSSYFNNNYTHTHTSQSSHMLFIMIKYISNVYFEEIVEEMIYCKIFETKKKQTVFQRLCKYIEKILKKKLKVTSYNLSINWTWKHNNSKT